MYLKIISSLCLLLAYLLFYYLAYMISSSSNKKFLKNLDISFIIFIFVFYGILFYLIFNILPLPRNFNQINANLKDNYFLKDKIFIFERKPNFTTWQKIK